MDTSWSQHINIVVSRAKQMLEFLQRNCGGIATYREACSITGIPLLKDRRRLLCERFFVKNAHGDKLGDLLPPKLEHNYNTRYGSDYNNYSCKTDRFMKSFFPQMVSHMNRP